jgi:outer membrane lipoprotein SlyB
MTLTPREKRDLGVSVAGGAFGGLVGYFVGRKTHPVVGLLVGLGVGAILSPAVIEAVTVK